jgi:hypothetical protein
MLLAVSVAYATPLQTLITALQASAEYFAARSVPLNLLYFTQWN